MCKSTCTFITLIIICSVLSLVCFIMSIVFAYVITLTYPDPIVNVQNNTNLATGVSVIEFYLRCDLANGGSYEQNILSNCGIKSFSIVPHCNLLSLQSYYYQTYAYGSVSSCPSGYLQSITATTNLGINYVALASSMMIIGIFLIWIPVLLFLCCNS